MSDGTFTFKNGRAVELKPGFKPKFINLAMMAWNRNNPTPNPPLISIEQRGGFKEVPNPNSAEHRENLAAHDRKRNDFFIRTSVVAALNTDRFDWGQLDTDYELARELGVDVGEVPTDQSERIDAYLTSVCEATQDESLNLVNWINGRGLPTDEGVQANMETTFSSPDQQ